MFNELPFWNKVILIIVNSFPAFMVWIALGFLFHFMLNSIGNVSYLNSFIIYTIVGLGYYFVKLAYKKTNFLK